jgi:hypothetical protein
MSLELLGRIHKELSITGSAVYEALLAVSERVNRKVQIIRLHWHASMLLERMEQVTGDLGRQVVDQVSRRLLAGVQPDLNSSQLDTILSGAASHAHDLKRSLLHIDAQIRELKLEAVHQDLLRLQRELSLRSAGIERITVNRHAPAVGQPLRLLPRSPSVHIATILRGPFLLAPDHDLILRPEDVVVLIGVQSELDRLTAWLTGSEAVDTAFSTPA